MSKEDKKDIFADYKPEVIEYDPEVDGGEVYKVRDEHLDHKEDALEKIRKAKAKAKDPRVNPSDYPTYRKESKSAVSFREAQRKAKSNGQKTFTWEGRRYNTKEK